MAFAMGASTAAQAEINVTPLIDVLLVLLIIFMVIVPVKPRGLNSQVPEPALNKAQVVPPLAPIVVDVAGVSGGHTKLLVNMREVPADELQNRLRGILALRQDKTVFVRGDRALSFQPVAQAVAEARNAGASPVALMSAVANH